MATAREAAPESADKDESGQTIHSPFDSLPDELLLKIITMVVENHRSSTYQLIHVIGKVSKRFQDIAATKSLWTECSPSRPLELPLSRHDDKEQQMKQLNVLHDGIEWLEVKGIDWEESFRSLTSAILSEDHLTAIGGHCPNLEALHFEKVEISMWPRFSTPFVDLLHLRLDGIEMNDDMFG